MRGKILAALAFASACMMGPGIPGARGEDRLVLVAGGGSVAGDAPATEAKLIHPFGVDFDGAGNAWIVELTGQRLLKVDPEGKLVVAGGTGKKGNEGDGGPAKEATFNDMHALAIHPDGTIYLADTHNNRIRRYDPKTGTISAFAGVGTGAKGYAGDGGPAKEARFSGIFCIALDPQGKRLCVTDLGNRRIRVIDLATGRIDLAAGNGEKGVPQDGKPAREQPLVDPRAAAIDREGRIYILERSGNALRVVEKGGAIRTALGGLAGPKHLCIDPRGDVIIADTDHHRIVKYLPGADSARNLVVLAGTGKKGSSGAGGAALGVALNEPHGVAIGPEGMLYIVDSLNDRVFRLDRGDR